MGWKTFYKASQDFFKSKYERSEKWGDLTCALIRVDTMDYYGAGIIGSSTSSGIGEKIKLQTNKIKLYAKLLIAFKASTTGSLNCYVTFYSNGDQIEDSEGYTAWGIRFVLDTPQPDDVVSFYDFHVELDGTKIAVYLDNEKIIERNLKLNGKSIVSSALILEISSISGEEPLAAIITYDVEAKYYDFIEDIINSMISSLGMVMQLMMLVIPISLIASAITSVVKKPKKEVTEKEAIEKKEEVVKEKPIRKEGV